MHPSNSGSPFRLLSGDDAERVQKRDRLLPVLEPQPRGFPVSEAVPLLGHGRSGLHRGQGIHPLLRQVLGGSQLEPG